MGTAHGDRHADAFRGSGQADPGVLAGAATGVLGRALSLVEKAVKVPLFGCHMCGQCILHETGLVCPMNCPKNLRNGPCGGVLVDGNCEVYPERPCVWVRAWESSQRLPVWKDHITHLQRPVDWRLQGTSSWANLASGRDRQVPAGWDGTEAQAVAGAGP